MDTPQPISPGSTPNPRPTPPPSLPPLEPPHIRPMADAGQAPKQFPSTPSPSPATPPPPAPKPFPIQPPISSPTPPNVRPIGPPPNIPLAPSMSSGQLGQIEARTMSSDIKSVQETGGGAPRPYVPPQIPGSIQTPSPLSGTPPLPPAQTPQNFARDAGQAGIMKPASTPSPMGEVPAKKSAGGSKKGIFTLLISLIIVIGAGVVGYFFVFPLFSGEDAPPPADTTLPPSPTAELPPPPATPGEDSGIFGIPQGDIGVPSGNATPPPADSTPPPAAPSLTHTSFLSTPSDLTSTISLTDVNASAIRTAVGFKTAQVASLKEIVFTRDGNPLRLSEFAPKILPELFIDLFDEDFTYAVYTDAKGSWPVYVFRLASGADAARAKSKFSVIEQASVSALGNLYLSSPGGAGGWKDGQVLGTAARYLAFTQSGASLNYVWIDNYLVLGTNYAAIQETVKRL